jgi:hypothetical protein
MEVKMEVGPKKDKYDEAKLELVNDMMEKYAVLSQELGIDFEPLSGDQMLFNTVAARKLEAIAIYAETGEGDPQTIFAFIQSVLMYLHAPAVMSLMKVDWNSIPDEFWSRRTGLLIAKALSRLHENELLTIKEAAQLAGVSMATVSIALDTGKLTLYIDPAARKHQKRRKVLRSEVLKRWGC